MGYCLNIYQNIYNDFQLISQRWHIKKNEKKETPIKLEKNDGVKVIFDEFRVIFETTAQDKLMYFWKSTYRQGGHLNIVIAKTLTEPETGTSLQLTVTSSRTSVEDTRKKLVSGARQQLPSSSSVKAFHDN